MEPAGNKEEKMLNYDIGIALGETSVESIHLALGETSVHLASVGDQDPQDPHVFWPPRSRSIS